MSTATLLRGSEKFPPLFALASAYTQKPSPLSEALLPHLYFEMYESTEECHLDNESVTG